MTTDTTARWRGHPCEDYVDKLVDALNVDNPYLPPLKPPGWVVALGSTMYKAHKAHKGDGALDTRLLTPVFEKHTPVFWRNFDRTTATTRSRKSRYRSVVQCLYVRFDEMKYFIGLTPRKRNAVFKLTEEKSETRHLIAAAKIYVAAVRKLEKEEES